MNHGKLAFDDFSNKAADTPTQTWYIIAIKLEL